VSERLLRTRVTLIDGDKRTTATVDAPLTDNINRDLDRVARRTRNAAQDLMDDAGLLPDDADKGSSAE
jgi:hypothetical protein